MSQVAWSILMMIVTFPAFAAAQDEMREMDMPGMRMDGFYGQYPMSRESSGTAWTPDSTPMDGFHTVQGDWMTMLHGYADLVYDDQGGKRGENKTFVEGMLMGMATHPLQGGTIGFRAMLSPDPLMGKAGYPLLLQTGETANGRDPLIDRQHPHNLFVELATTYSHPITPDSSSFVYFGYPGEPALGPPTFMHRFSGGDNPEAPIAHHWLDSTHITFGVATAGYVWKTLKIEGSVFTGREPDQYRYGFNKAKFDSYSGRLSYNPTKNWSLQISEGRIKSPEQLTPDVNQDRATASATYNLPFDQNNWQTTFAWGENRNHPGNRLNAFLLESALVLHDRHTFFARAEQVAKDELFTPVGGELSTSSALDGQTFIVNKFSLGYINDLPVSQHLKIGFGGLGSIYGLPNALTPYYGSNPFSFMLFVRGKIK